MSNASDDNGEEIIVDDDCENENEDDNSRCSVGKIDPEELAMAYDDEAEDEEEDDEDDSSDFSSTDESSTTSTSSTTNQQDNTRVCDCCYCEVFGHGSTHVAPTSRNFNEMRERLRQRLSKRRAERCERSTQQQQQKGANTNQNENSNDKGGGGGALVGSDDDASFRSNQNNTNGQNKQQPYALMEIEDILNYINGTSQDKSSNNKKKDKDKNKSNNNNSNSRKNKNKSNAAPAKEDLKYSEKCHQIHHNNSNGANLHSNNSSGTCQQNNLSMSIRRHQNNSNQSIESHSNQSSEHHHHHHHNQNGGGRRGSCSGGGANSKGNNKSSNSEAGCNRNASSDQSHGCHRSGGNNEKQKRKDRDKASNKASKNQKIPTKTTATLCDDDLEDSLFTEPDDVFLPRDIDLNDDDLDEFERELEAFKRFCLDSVTLIKKERVRVQLRDSNCFKKFNHRCIAAIENKIAIQ